VTVSTASLCGRAALVLAILLCPKGTAAAQGWAAGWEIGVKSGISHAGLTDSREFEWTNTPTSSAFAKRRIAGPLWIAPELSLLRRTGVSAVAGSRLTLTADYLELPLMLQLQLLSAKGVAPFFSAGPNLALRLKCRLQFVGGGVRTDDDCDTARSAESNPLDIGVAGGGGVNWSIGVITLSVEARLIAGLRPNVLPIDVPNSRSFGWSALAGISMPLYRTRSMPPMRLPPLAALPLQAPPTLPSAQAPAQSREALMSSVSTRRVTITADDVDARQVIMGIAIATGMNVIVSPLVTRRVSARLYDVGGEEAIQAVADVAGLSVMRPAAPGGYTIVFSQPPVNINQASSAQISSRFDVSGEMARWIAENRTPAPAKP